MTRFEVASESIIIDTTSGVKLMVLSMTYSVRDMKCIYTHVNRETSLLWTTYQIAIGKVVNTRAYIRVLS